MKMQLQLNRGTSQTIELNSMKREPDKMRHVMLFVNGDLDNAKEKFIVTAYYNIDGIAQITGDEEYEWATLAQDSDFYGWIYYNIALDTTDEVT